MRTILHHRSQPHSKVYNIRCENTCPHGAEILQLVGLQSKQLLAEIGKLIRQLFKSAYITVIYKTQVFLIIICRVKHSDQKLCNPYYQSTCSREKYEVFKQSNICSSTNTFQNCKFWACDHEPTTSCQFHEIL